MKKRLPQIKLAIVLAIVWSILMEQFDGVTLIAGFFIGLGASIVTDEVLLQEHYHRKYGIALSVLIRYFIFLMVEIYQAGWFAVKQMIKGKTQVEILEYKTPLEDELLICLLAISITLTPGTIVVEKQGSKLKILSLYNQKNPEEELVSKKIENLLLSENRRRHIHDDL